jgi:hypothetical protein
MKLHAAEGPTPLFYDIKQQHEDYNLYAYIINNCYNKLLAGMIIQQNVARNLILGGKYNRI